jgi:myosin heavy subunit
MAAETHNARFYGMSLRVDTSIHEDNGFPVHASSQPCSPKSCGSQNLDDLRQSLKNFVQGPSRASLIRKNSFSGLSTIALASRLQEAYSLLRQKDEDLKLASEIGTLLIDKNEELTVQSANAEAKVESLLAELHLLQEERKEDKARARQLQAKYEHLTFEHEELLATVDKLKSQLERESTKRGQLQQTFSKVGGQADQELHSLRVAVDSLQKQVEALTFQNLKSCKALEESDDALAAANEELSTLRDEVNRLSRVESQFQKLSSATQDTEKLRAIVADLQWENQQFTKSIRELQFENSRLTELHEKDIKIFEEMQAELDVLQEDMSENPSQALRNLASDETRRSMLSLADEWMAEHKRLAKDFEVSYEDMGTQTDVAWAEKVMIQNMVAEADRSSEDPSSAPSADSRNDIDPHRADREAKMEFFMLTVLCVKINMGGRMDVVCTKSNRELYEEAMKERVPFHQFQDWIERALMKAYIDTTCRIDPKILTESERASIKAIESPRLSRMRPRSRANLDDGKSEPPRRSVAILKSAPDEIRKRPPSSHSSDRFSVQSPLDEKQPSQASSTSPALSPPQ